MKLYALYIALRESGLLAILAALVIVIIFGLWLCGDALRRLILRG
jgi:hypothetical protein